MSELWPEARHAGIAAAAAAAAAATDARRPLGPAHCLDELCLLLDEQPKEQGVGSGVPLLPAFAPW